MCSRGAVAFIRLMNAPLCGPSDSVYERSHCLTVKLVPKYCGTDFVRKRVKDEDAHCCAELELNLQARLHSISTHTNNTHSSSMYTNRYMYTYTIHQFTHVAKPNTIMRMLTLCAPSIPTRRVISIFMAHSFFCSPPSSSM